MPPQAVSVISRCSRRLFVVGLLASTIIGCGPAKTNDPADQQQPRSGIHGRVTAAAEPVEGARVRIKGTSISTRTKADGSFRLDATLDVDDPQVVTAAKQGFFIQGKAADSLPVSLTLTAIPRHDCEDYEWIDPTPDDDMTLNCGNCHLEIYREWQAGGHSQSATNRRFLDLYAGTDWHGNPDVGWNLLKDYPEGAGVCNACHAPGASLDELGVADIREVKGVARQGVHCDLCHKTEEVSTAAVGLTHGRFGMSLLRPEHGQLFFGPLDDVDRGEDIYSPLQSQSQFCASCHEGVVFGVHVYSTYSEWLESPAGRSGKQCQACHMRPTGTMTNFAPDAGGITRDPLTLASHKLLRDGRQEMLADCLHVTSDVKRIAGKTNVQVTIKTRNVGHRVPTGFIDRHLLLAVEAFADAAGLKSVAAESGPTLPPAAGNLASQAGKLYAKQLERGDALAPFWRMDGALIDTRLQPDAVETQEFVFPEGTTQVRIRLIYRRFWHEIAEQKQWPDNEIVVYDETVRMDGSNN